MNKLKKKINLSKWQHFEYMFKDSLISKEIIKSSIYMFLTKRLKNVSDDIHFNVIFKVYINNFDGFKSITYKFRACKKEHKEILEYCYEAWSVKSEEYKSSLCSSIAFAYRLLPKELNIKNSSFPKMRGVDNKVVFQFGGYNLPRTMELIKWGKCVWIDNSNVIISKLNSKAIYNVVVYDDRNEVELKINNRLLAKFVDYKSEVNLNSFKRVINNQEYVIKDGIIVFKTLTRKCKFISKIKKSSHLTENFITMDIETINFKKVLKAYCVCIYDGKEKVTFFLDQYKNSEHMLESSIKFLMKRKYNGYRVYLHNFSNFDSVFLINTLHKLTKNTLKPSRRNGKLIDVQFKYGNNILYFRDSYLLLPSSLRKLAISFEVENKGIFPHTFVDEKGINYVGTVPSLKYFFKLNINSSYSEWLDSVEIIRECQSYRGMFKDKPWNLKEESIKYCLQDVVTLHQVIKKFNELIFKRYRVDVHKYPTLPSLAFAIYRSNFIGDVKIPIITGSLYNFLHRGYTGGSVDVYKPYGKNIYRYDVNSLYPYVMKKFPVPVGNPVYFEGDVLKFKSKPFGVFEVKVTTPENIKIPLLQRRIKVNGNISTISPLGSWKGVYFSEELNNAINHGYKIEVIKGFLFDKQVIFSDYVNQLYNIKENSEKNSAEYTISKMLMNSLYGRFGMNPEIESHEVVDDKKAFEIENNDKFIVTDITPLDNDKLWISFITQSKEEYVSEEFVNVSVSVALAISSYARIHMSTFKTDMVNSLYYMDTDSVDLDTELQPNLIGTKLGEMKFEHSFKEAVYLAPKVYGGIAIKTSNDGKEIYELVKAKGYKNKLSFSDVKPLLNKDSVLKLEQSKWYKNYTKEEINIKDEIYSLMVTSNKRKLIYNSEGVLINTLPFIVNE